MSRWSMTQQSIWLMEVGSPIQELLRQELYEDIFNKNSGRESWDFSANGFLFQVSLWKRHWLYTYTLD